MPFIYPPYKLLNDIKYQLLNNNNTLEEILQVKKDNSYTCLELQI